MASMNEGLAKSGGAGTQVTKSGFAAVTEPTSRKDTQNQSQFSGIANQEALGILMDFIRQTAGGGTPEQRAQRAERNTEIQRTRALGGDYSKSAAFADAALLMEQNLRKSLEANMPAISRSIQGAGTSASSMQGLLSQKLATESAQAAGALGAEQAKAYGNISANLQGVLEALTRIDPSIENSLLKALELTRVQASSSTSSSSTSGGGTRLVPTRETVTEQPLQAAAPLQALAASAPAFYSPAPAVGGGGGGYIQNTSTGFGTVFEPSGAVTDFYSPLSYEAPVGRTDEEIAASNAFGDFYG